MKSFAIAALLGAVQAKCPAKMTAFIYSDAECKNVVDSAATTKHEINKWTTCQKLGDQELGVMYTCTETGLDVQEFKNPNCDGTADKTVTIEYNKCSEYSSNKNPLKQQFVKLVEGGDEMTSDKYPPEGNGDAPKGDFDPNVALNPEKKDNSMALKATAATLLALAAI